MTTTVTGQLVFEIAACDGHFRYNVTFQGPDASAQAMTYIERQEKKHQRSDGLGQIVWDLDFDRSDESLVSEELSSFLWPSCEHGLSLRLCAGPGHYPIYHPYN
jgi:hypothetical protein